MTQENAMVLDKYTKRIRELNRMLDANAEEPETYSEEELEEAMHDLFLANIDAFEHSTDEDEEYEAYLYERFEEERAVQHKYDCRD